MSGTREFAILRVGFGKWYIKELRSVKDGGEHLQRIVKFMYWGRRKSHAKQESFSFPRARPRQISGKKSYSRWAKTCREGKCTHWKAIRTYKRNYGRIGISWQKPSGLRDWEGISVGIAGLKNPIGDPHHYSRGRIPNLLYPFLFQVMETFTGHREATSSRRRWPNCTRSFAIRNVRPFWPIFFKTLKTPPSWRQSGIPGSLLLRIWSLPSTAYLKPFLRITKNVCAALRAEVTRASKIWLWIFNACFRQITSSSFFFFFYRQSPPDTSLALHYNYLQKVSDDSVNFEQKMCPTIKPEDCFDARDFSW